MDNSYDQIIEPSPNGLWTRTDASYGVAVGMHPSRQAAVEAAAAGGSSYVVVDEHVDRNHNDNLCTQHILRGEISCWQK